MTPYFSFEKMIWSACQDAELQFHRFERFLDKPVIPRGRENSHDEHRVAAPNVRRDNGHFTAWYTGMRTPNADAWHQEDRHSVCVAYSDDGINWEKPDLKLKRQTHTAGEPNNVLNMTNNFYLIGVTRSDGRYVMKIDHPRGYKRDVPQTTFSIYTSEDGLRWRGRRQPMIDAQHFEAHNSIYKCGPWYCVLGQGVSPYFCGPNGEIISRADFVYRSKDLKNWSLVPGPAYQYPMHEFFTESSLQCHGGGTVTDRGRLQLGFMGQFWPAGFAEMARATFGLIYSYDGMKWTEPFVGQPLLLPACQPRDFKCKEWDRGMILQGNGCFNRDAYTYGYYWGCDGGNTYWAKAATGLARMRRDGFSHWQSSNPRRAASLTTDHLPLSARDEALYLNADLGRNGRIAVSILDGRSQRSVSSHQIKEGGVMVKVGSLPKAKDAKLKLRFELHGTSRLYSFYLGKDNIDVPAYLRDWQ